MALNSTGTPAPVTLDAESAAITSAGGAPDAEAAFAKTVSIPANRLKAGSRIRIVWAVFCSDGAAGATVTIRVRIGGVAGTLLATSGSIDPATNDWVQGVVELEVLTTGGGGTFQSVGNVTNELAAGVSHSDTLTRAGAVDTTAAKVVNVTAQWSGAAGDDVILSYLTVE